MGRYDEATGDEARPPAIRWEVAVLGGIVAGVLVGGFVIGGLVIRHRATMAAEAEANAEREAVKAHMEELKAAIGNRQKLQRGPDDEN